MPIAVVCPGCKTQFQVSEKFAGKKGPCPKCKAIIAVPAAPAPGTVPPPLEVKIHEPEQYAAGGKGVTGKLLTKPIPRPKVRLRPRLLAAVGGGTLVILAVAWLGRSLIHKLLALKVAGLLAISPPLVIAGYLFLRSDEDLQPYRGRALWLRSGICAMVYAALWGGFALVPNDFIIEYWSWFYIAPPFLVLGAVAALASLDLDFTSAFFHYCFYVLATIAVRYVAGLPLTLGPPT